MKVARQDEAASQGPLETQIEAKEDRERRQMMGVDPKAEHAQFPASPETAGRGTERGVGVVIVRAERTSEGQKTKSLSRA
jgi:hypothetical protein